ncbi:hypothetical protein [Isoptericola croceus]|uniref:hypothetical protein n=1 Tax=Isoptericola croceus TaxID=3031406 RepID=UPI0023F90ABD|nr:hypothetical protein [Isoptericola croceus]
MVFEYTRWLNASANAFNYSALELAELMAASAEEAKGFASHTVSDKYNRVDASFTNNDQRLFEGPDQIVIEDIVETDDGLIEVKTCHRKSAYWTKAGRTLENERHEITAIGDGIERVEPLFFRPATFEIIDVEGRWVVDKHYAYNTEVCDPGADVTRGTYDHNNDPEFLLEVTTDWLVDPDGKQGVEK